MGFWLSCWFLKLACLLSFLARFALRAVFIGSLVTWRGRHNLKSAYSNTTYLVPDDKSARSDINHLIPESELEECSSSCFVDDHRRSFQWFLSLRKARPLENLRQR
ncbi:hypothetical protein EV401DRAFT_1896913 [Pisolithus croceorrhizus]|nr:hypothetical protein EV401DRAFT_1896913 [Pisolithus croceorrhizus]